MVFFLYPSGIGRIRICSSKKQENLVDGSTGVLLAFSRECNPQSNEDSLLKVKHKYIYMFQVALFHRAISNTSACWSTMDQQGRILSLKGSAQWRQTMLPQRCQHVVFFGPRLNLVASFTMASSGASPKTRWAFAATTLKPSNKASKALFTSVGGIPLTTTRGTELSLSKIHGKKKGTWNRIASGITTKVGQT